MEEVLERASGPQELRVARNGEALVDPRAARGLEQGHDDALAAARRHGRADDHRLERGALADRLPDGPRPRDQRVELPAVAVVRGGERQEDQVRLVGELELVACRMALRAQLVDTSLVDVEERDLVSLLPQPDSGRGATNRFVYGIATP